MEYSLRELSEIWGLPNPEISGQVDTLLIDSRKIGNAQTSVFFALEGPRRNGHLYVPELYEKGLRYFVVSQPFQKSQYPSAVFFVVPDVLAALQQLAAAHRNRFSYPVIGVTGSNGKTVVKEWLFQLLQPDHHIVRSPRSYNSQIGVPLSVWQMSPQNDLAIFEAGISQRGEMEKLQKIIRPDIGVFTNIGEAHSEGFSSMAEKLAEKFRLFAHCKVVVLPGDDASVRKCAAESGIRPFTWGLQEGNDLQVISTKTDKNDTIITFSYQSVETTIRIPFTDAASIKNAITCCAVWAYLGESLDNLKERISALHPVNMRLEFKKGINNCTIINDSYSADMDSLVIALNFLQQQAQQQNKTVILSDFISRTDEEKVFYEKLLELLHTYSIGRFIGIGETMSSLMPKLLAEKAHDYKVELYPSTENFTRHFQQASFKDEVILVKGARVFMFEKIVGLLQQKQHQTILEINLDAIAHNLKFYQKCLEPTTKIMVMVKAFAYGSGSAEVARVLQYNKVDYLGVAYTDEGVELRKAGVSVPIMVMNPEENAFEAMTEYQLEPDIYSLAVLQSFEQHLQREGLEQYPVHIEVETGMNRLGFSVEDIAELGSYLKNNSYIKVQSVFSHFVASEDPAEDAFTRYQYELLVGAANQLRSFLDYDFIRHICNSSGIMRFPQFQLDMVRLGIGLYGIYEQPDADLQPVATLKSTVAQIKHLQKGETVSYNRRGVAKEDMTIATVRIGYADGYSRRLGNGVGYMLIHGQPARVVGTVCMDMTMVDVTHIPDVQEGDEAIVFGPGLPIQALADAIGTIPYEIMTGISQRVKRVYYGE
ncbi:MAG: bifunctional UDP-N-acetylmuramoyl-tripeptide:D-alanyl-D-alanine ligase/alanine racemase [Niabella sp.]